MPKLEYFVVAESHSVDRDTNSLSIFNIYNERKFDSFPVTIPRLVLVSCWLSDPEEIQERKEMQIGVVLKGGDFGQRPPFNINFTCDVEFQNVLLEYRELEVSKPGKFTIEILLNGKHEADHVVSLKLDDSQA